jgi:hypothetical protein
MRTDLKEICRDLRWLADSMPPGKLRNQMQADLARLRVKLDAMPARVGVRAAMKSAAEVKVVLEEEFVDAFRDVLRWFEEPKIEILKAARAKGLRH